MAFKKGQSGNPNGRPKKISSATTQIEKMLSKRDQVDPKDPTKFLSRREVLFDKLYHLTIGGDMSAAKLLIEQGFGRPKQTIDMDANVNHTEIPPLNISTYSTIDDSDSESEEEAEKKAE